MPSCYTCLVFYASKTCSKTRYNVTPKSSLNLLLIVVLFILERYSLSWDKSSISSAMSTHRRPHTHRPPMFCIFSLPSTFLRYVIPACSTDAATQTTENRSPTGEKGGK
ncbi:hypothetical protein XENOCAPTIV_012755 [Xenoophorus captivus]|uniref:Secreted protein n=1 Tax=Xenoophorus captivus TaxID=1517983 RepID=A0ABV0RJ45_9TELE